MQTPWVSNWFSTKWKSRKHGATNSSRMIWGWFGLKIEEHKALQASCAGRLYRYFEVSVILTAQCGTTLWACLRYCLASHQYLLFQNLSFIASSLPPTKGVPTLFSSAARWFLGSSRPSIHRGCKQFASIESVIATPRICLD